MTFKKLLEMWLKEKSNYVKESTYAYYDFEVRNYIVPCLGHLSLEEITEERIQETVLLWQNQGMNNGHPLKKSTVQNLTVLLKQVLKYGARKKVMADMNLTIQFAVQPQMNKRKVFDVNEQRRLIQAVLSDLNNKTFGILLCLNSGLRIGELCALKWEDIDIDNGVLHVTKTLQRIYDRRQHGKTEIIITSPKTVTSVRDVPISKRVLSIISMLPQREGAHYILTNSARYTEPRRFRQFYKEFLIKNEIDELHFHCLRHTFATRCIEGGADYKSVSEILGHTTIHTTLNMYVHPQMEEKRKCVEMVNWE